MHQHLVLFLKGMAMGAANVIPGVSGGTIAFITNIYERLINALKAFDLEAVRLLLKFDFKAFAKKVDFTFLLFVGLGVLVSIFSIAKVLEYAFSVHETLTLSFFFGLIVASIFSVVRQIANWNVGAIAGMLIGTAMAVTIAFLVPAAPSTNFFYVVLCGIVGITSMILPGLSGAYILLLMGNYILVLRAVGSFDFSILVPLAIGCVLGLVLFSRALAYLFSRYKDVTVALLAGFVTGSLLIIWPWKITEFQEFEGKMKATGYEWYFPTADGNLLLAILLAIAGFSVVFFIDRAGEER